MSLPRETMLALMALADDELEGEERTQAEALTASSEEARRIVEAMRASDVSRWLEEAMAPRLSAADGIADAVVARIEAGGADGVVRRIDSGKKRRAQTMFVVVSVATVLAAAAVIALMLRGQSATMQPSAPAPVANAPVVAPMPVPPPAVTSNPTAPSLTEVAEQAANAGLGVEVNEIDSPAHDVTVFEIPLAGAAAAMSRSAASSVVIMIADDDGGKP
jgi:hypothetical protein